MPRRQRTLRRLTTASRWPLGVALTSWRYMWRTTPIHRWEMSGSAAEDSPPEWSPGTDLTEIQHPGDGAGPLVHRVYRTRIEAPRVDAEQLMECLRSDLNRVAPSEFASFQRLDAGDGAMEVGDDYVVRMPGPWDGPVRVVSVTPTSFRLATLEGHLEAGQIEFRAFADHRSIEFVIESWARSGDRLSDLLYSHARMAKEVQLHMWTSLLERVAELTGGRMERGITITTKRVDPGANGEARGPGPDHSRARRRLEALSGRELNFDLPGEPDRMAEQGWHTDDMTAALPGEASGPPQDGGSWEVARELMIAYQVADPDVVRATYRHDAPLAGRDMLLQIRFLGVRFHVGVRVGEVYDETREVDGRQARVFGWDYSTLEGHFEEGKMHYEVWKWLETGEVEFRLRAFSRVARSGPPLLRLGFRLVGRRQQLRFYQQACRRMRRLTEAELDVRRG